MKGPLLLVCLLLLLCQVKSQSIDDEWEKFKIKTGRRFNTPIEEAKHKVAFIGTHHFIKAHNRKYDNERSTFEVAHNEFSDVPRGNFLRRLGLRFPPRKVFVNVSNIDELRPFKKNLRQFYNFATQKGVVGIVKDQGTCGSSYAFAIGAAIESQFFLKYNQTIEVSEQQIVDCSKESGNDGCAGGWFTDTFEYLRKFPILINSRYTYEREENKCFNNDTLRSVLVRSYKYYGRVNEKQLQQIVLKHGPAAVAIDASDRRFQQYSDGVYFVQGCGKDLGDLNHAVLLTGYGSNIQDGAYWIIKNSWGKSWGRNGFAKIARNRQNTCGIATAAYVPVLE